MEKTMEEEQNKIQKRIAIEFVKQIEEQDLRSGHFHRVRRGRRGPSTTRSWGGFDGYAELNDNEFEKMLAVGRGRVGRDRL